MSAAKHTPGPWIAEWFTKDGNPLRLVPGYPIPEGATAVIRAGYINARYRPGVAQHITTEADARLIAAAPELLKALEFALRDMEATRAQFATHAPNVGVLAASIVTARAAIAAATGQQPEPTR